MEALGLAVFMISACFFTVMFEHPNSNLRIVFPNDGVRLFFIAVAMALTALFIFYAPFIAPSGSYINPAVTLVNYRLKNINATDTFFYIVFQFAGGTAAVYLMAWLMGNLLTNEAINYAITLPAKNISISKAIVCELAIAFIMMLMILYTSAHKTLHRFTKIFTACLVFLYVLVAGPISGFGMNPARSFASALPAHNFNYFWIYLFCPIVGMMCAAELYLRQNNWRAMKQPC